MRLQGVAEEEPANAEMYAGMVVDARQAIDDENQRVMDVASARTAVEELTRCQPRTSSMIRGLAAPSPIWCQAGDRLHGRHLLRRYCYGR